MPIDRDLRKLTLEEMHDGYRETARQIEEEFGVKYRPRDTWTDRADAERTLAGIRECHRVMGKAWREQQKARPETISGYGPPFSRELKLWYNQLVNQL